PPRDRVRVEGRRRAQRASVGTLPGDDQGAERVTGPRERTQFDPAAPLQDAEIVVGVGGGIAAYKACELVRLFIKAGAKVQVVMTRRATKFVGPLTFQALTGRKVFTNLFSLTQESEI